MAWLGAALGIASKLLGFAERADKKQERRDDMQTGAKISRVEQLEAENEKLRADLAEASKPSDPARAKRELRERMRKRAARSD